MCEIESLIRQCDDCSELGNVWIKKGNVFYLISVCDACNAVPELASYTYSTEELATEIWRAMLDTPAPLGDREKIYFFHRRIKGLLEDMPVFVDGLREAVDDTETILERTR